MTEPTANEVSPHFEHGHWTQWPNNWKTYPAEQGYNGNHPTLYVTSPTGIEYKFNPNLHFWTKI